MSSAVSPLHLSLADAACGSSAAVTRWLRNAGGANRTALLDPDVCARTELSLETAQRWLDRGDSDQAEALTARHWHSLALGDPAYPDLLASLDDAPPILFVHGRLESLSAPQVAMVGSRHPSLEGRENAFAFARTLAGAGFLVTSGLALGIDTAAHRGALDSGTTIAVMGCGPDRIYPARQQSLADRIADQGALVTEFPPGMPPLKENFPRRNRIISGLSLATVVVEAAIRSGSLITARLAAEQGREVFAVPGSIHNPLSKGCHRLLRDGAAWLEDMTDLLEHLDAMEQLGQVSATADTPDDPLLHAFTGGLNTLEQLHHRTGMPVPRLTRELTRLELEGQVERLPGGYQSRRPGTR